MKDINADQLNHTSIWDLADWKSCFDPKASALFIIDPQNDILSERGNMSYWGVWKTAETSMRAIKTTVDFCREHKIPIFWFKYTRPRGNEAIFPGTISSIRIIEQRKRVPNIFKNDDWDTEFHDFFLELIRKEDFIIEKPSSGCFDGTILDKVLRQLGTRDLLITGYLTDFCVSNTARSAYDRGYGAIVVGDACGTRQNGFHDEALKHLHWYFSPVINSSDLESLVFRL